MMMDVLEHNSDEIHFDARGEYFARYKNYTIRSAFQPIFNNHEHIVAIEALVRIKNNDAQRLINPEHFFQSDIISKMDKLNVERLSRALHINNYALSGYHHLKLFLNVLPCFSQLLNGPVSGRTTLTNHLEIKHIPTENIVLEIMELACNDNRVLVNSTKRLAHKGFTIAIDDFGVKASTPARVNAINPDIIKLDRSLLLAYMNGDQRALELSVQFAKTKGALTVIEGIETQQQLDAMRALDIDMHQGFFLGTPKYMTEC